MLSRENFFSVSSTKSQRGDSVRSFESRENIDVAADSNGVGLDQTPTFENMPVKLWSPTQLPLVEIIGGAATHSFTVPNDGIVNALDSKTSITSNPKTNWFCCPCAFQWPWQSASVQVNPR